MEFFSLMMERVVDFWRNRRFFQFRKFQCPLAAYSMWLSSIDYLRHVTKPDKNSIPLHCCVEKKHEPEGNFYERKKQTFQTTMDRL